MRSLYIVTIKIGFWKCVFFIKLSLANFLKMDIYKCPILHIITLYRKSWPKSDFSREETIKDEKMRKKRKKTCDHGKKPFLK